MQVNMVQIAVTFNSSQCWPSVWLIAVWICLVSQSSSGSTFQCIQHAQTWAHASITKQFDITDFHTLILFLIYINNLPDTITSSIRLFADDCVIYRNICEPSDPSQLQTDLNTISAWCNTWLMKLNVDKCKYMRLTRTIKHTPVNTYFLNGSPLLSVTTYK